MKDILEIIKSNVLREVYFGPSGFTITDEATINELQLGYSVNPDGSDLTGSNEGDWQKSWVVIGNDSELGDPFFVDANNPSLPVYTAMHGLGEWSPDQVSNSLSSFIEALKYLNRLSKQEFARINPDDNSITNPDEISSIEKKLCELSGEEDYWHNFIVLYREWLEEFGD